MEINANEELNQSKVEQIRDAISDNDFTKDNISQSSDVKENSTENVETFDDAMKKANPICDPNELKKQAKSIRDYGISLEMLIKSAYKKVEEMQVYWNGKDYNLIRREFNRNSIDLNRFLTIVTSQLPDTLEEISYLFIQMGNNEEIDKATNNKEYEPITFIMQSKDKEEKYNNRQC